MNQFSKRLAGTPFFAVIILVALWSGADAQELPERAAGMDANKNGVIDRGEARGPLASNFDAMDRDKSGGIDGAELAAFFGGAGVGPRSWPAR